MSVLILGIALLAWGATARLGAQIAADSTDSDERTAAETTSVSIATDVEDTAETSRSAAIPESADANAYVEPVVGSTRNSSGTSAAPRYELRQVPVVETVVQQNSDGTEDVKQVQRTVTTYVPVTRGQSGPRPTAPATSQYQSRSNADRYYGYGPGGSDNKPANRSSAAYWYGTSPDAKSPPEEKRLEEKTHVLVDQLRKTDDDADHDEIVDKLKEVLDEHFELRMSRREKQVQELEERLARLREQVENRREMKREIIDLRLKTLINEAKGLGF